MHWCLVHRTALAEAEVEYEDHTSPSIYVRFPIVDGDALGKADPRLAGARRRRSSSGRRRPGRCRRTWRSSPTPSSTTSRSRASGEYPDRRRRAAPRRSSRRPGSSAPKDVDRDLARRSARAGGRALHAAVPAADADAGDGIYRLCFARHATLEAGTGLVHTAPGHGADDYIVGREHGLPIYAPVDDAGKFDRRGRAGAKLVGTQRLRGQPEDRRRARGRAASCSTSRARRCATSTRTAGAARTRSSSAPPSSGSRASATADDAKSLRHRGAGRDRQDAVDPAVGREPHPRHDRGAARLVLSRQRVWGVPIPAFRCRNAGRTCSTRRLWTTWPRSSRARGRTRGSRAAPDCCPPDAASVALRQKRVGEAARHRRRLVRVGRVVGRGRRRQAGRRRARRSTSTSRAPTSTAAGSTRRCSSSTATRGQAPYKAVLTHGWVLDERGKVYSKSEIAKARAARRQDRLRRAGRLDGEERRRAAAPVDGGRRLPERHRLLADDPQPARRVVPQDPQHLPVPAVEPLRLRAVARRARRSTDLRELDLLALGVLRERDHQVFEAYRRYAFHDVVRLLTDSVITHVGGVPRPGQGRALLRGGRLGPCGAACRPPLYEMARTLATWMAPILCFTAAGRRRRARARDRRDVRRPRQRARRASIRRARRWANPNKRWLEEIRPRREAILRPLEKFRAEGHKSLEARVRVKPARRRAPALAVEPRAPHRAVRSSRASSSTRPTRRGRATEIAIDEAPGPTCPRCWRRTGEAVGPAPRSQPVRALRRRRAIAGAAQEALS